MQSSRGSDVANAGMWAAIWFAGAMTVGGVIGILDPDSLDPGDTSGMAMVMGLMAVLSGTLFALLLRMARARVGAGVLACGLLATAIVQLALLGHGDAGLAANIRMALVMCGFGVAVTACWIGLMRRRTTR